MKRYKIEYSELIMNETIRHPIFESKTKFKKIEGKSLEEVIKIFKKKMYIKREESKKIILSNDIISIKLI